MATTVTDRLSGATSTQDAAFVTDIDHVDSDIKSGSDGTLITGTFGTAAWLTQWDANGDLVDGKAAPTGDVVGTSDAQTLTNKTLTSPVLNTGVSGTAVLDEDTMSSDSDTQLATQQSIKAYRDSLLTTENLALSGGATVSSKDLGTTTTGTLTLDMGDRPLQHYINGGSHTLAPGSVVGACIVDITNDGSAGTITVSGWTNTAGDDFTTTNGHKFRCHCSVGDAGSLLVVQAMQ